MIVEVINTLVIVASLFFLTHKILEHYNWRRKCENHYTTRFVEATTKIYINPPFIIEDNDFTDDPILRRALGKETTKKDQKEISVRTTIDLEEIFNYTESTSSGYEATITPSDCTMIYFRNGDELLIYEQYDTFQTYFETYLAQKRSL